MQFTDIIAAPLTAPGKGAVGIVRLSGDGAVRLAASLYDGRAALEEADTHTVHYGWVRDPKTGVRVDEALFLVMRAPRSYTGEEVAEIQCHGGAVAVSEVLRLCALGGARLAEAGEFTERAFLNGKLDLTRAEAIMDIVEAKSDAALVQAAAQKSGALYHAVVENESALLEAIAYVQADLDFPEDDIERLTDEALSDRVQRVRESVAALSRGAARGRIFREGIRMVIAGRPNVGKSSLLNALIGRDRAIVTDIAGTTRDVVSEALSIRGVPVELLDTAGLRATDDAVEAIGVERAREAAEAADLILYCVDATAGLLEEDAAFVRETEQPLLYVINKSDLRDGYTIADGLHSEVRVSARFGTGLEALEAAVYETIMAKVEAGGQAAANVRQLSLLEEAERFLESFLEGLTAGMSKDILVIDLQNARETLGLITGETADEDLVHEIFSRFCIGK